jgi:hypothetical protein
MATPFYIQQRINSIVDAVIKKTNLSLTFIKQLDGYNIHLMNEKGKDFVIVCYGPNNNKFFVRSLLKRNRKARMTWFCNGQPASGCTSIHEWPEGDFIVEDPMPFPTLSERKPCNATDLPAKTNLKTSQLLEFGTNPLV